MEESYVSLAELKVILEKEKTVRGELNPEQQYSLSHSSRSWSFASLNVESERVTMNPDRFGSVSTRNISQSSTDSFGESEMARWRTFRSSRMFPGQSY